jgi:hypothetical protein
MRELYVVLDGHIINCVTTSRSVQEVEASLRGRGLAFDRLGPNPPIEMLERYEFWHARP